MTIVALTMHEGIWGELTRGLDSSEELCGVAFARRSAGVGGTTYIVTRVQWLPEDGYVERSPVEIVAHTSRLIPLLADARERDEIPIFFHTHPAGRPRFSRKDDVVDEQLRPLFTGRSRAEEYVSLVIAGTVAAPTFCARRWLGAVCSDVSYARVIGEQWRMVHAGMESSEVRPIFDRQVRAFGSEGQAVLGGLRVGVVGAGGTGSATVELLARLGVGSITVLDHDVLTETNVTRVHESRVEQRGTPKVEVARAAVEGMGLGTAIHAAQMKVTSEEAVALLSQCDVVFGCTDDHGGRNVLSRLPYWYLVPVIDMGFRIAATDGAVRGLYGRVSVVTPGAPCLVCRGAVDLDMLRQEALSPDERSRLAAEGYADGLDDPDPAVGMYTTLVASAAVHELVDRLFGIGADAPPAELLFQVDQRQIRKLKTKAGPSHYCADLSEIGRGDEEPKLGMSWAG